MRDGDDHTYLGFWSEDGTFSRWYINMEQHYRRTSIGIDFVDHFLDVVIDGNLTSWRWKDEDELAAAVSTGLITRQVADAIRAEGQQATARLEAHAPPFNEAGRNGSRPEPVDPHVALQLADSGCSISAMMTSRPTLASAYLA